jgi:aromatic-amino-acid transaminase
MSLFSAVELAPRDPILGLNEQFNADPNPAKVNLGVGVYFDDAGKLPLLACVKAAEQQLTDAAKPRGYLPIDGIAAYDKAVQGLVFGSFADGQAALAAGRVATVQALGGTGGLKVGADFLKKLNPGAKVLISDPSWENHRALFTNAGFGWAPTLLRRRQPRRELRRHAGRPEGRRRRHHRGAARLLPQPDRLRHHPGAVGRGDRGAEGPRLVPFLDMAYQGFGDGIAEDGAVIRQFLAAGVESFFVATSFSKSFSLYGERVGALSWCAPARTRRRACCRS